MMKDYEQPMMEVITFGLADVVTFSGNNGDGFGDLEDKAEGDLDWE